MAEENKKNAHNTEDEHLQDTPSSHEYDGIVELDNPSPKWIIVVFMITIAFAVIYAIHYFGHPNTDNDQLSEYEQKVAAFELEKEAMRKNSSNAVEMDETAIIAAGQKLYAEKGCIACHGTGGEGNAIGPNLTDNSWLNGCSTEEVVKIISEGKPEKGMTPYKNMMSEKQIEQLTTYILSSLVGSEPTNAKEAQGEVCD